MRQLGVFAKYPAPGRCKTRLAAAIGPEAASHVARAMLELVLERHGKIADQRVLAYTPADDVERFRAMASNSWMLEPQGAGDLGQRMQGFFARAFASGITDAVLIGADSPTMPIGFIEQAFVELTHAPVVLGPSDDGGYFLVGSRALVPPIFAGVDWGSEQVWRQTTELLATAGVPFATIPAWYDVDQAADLPRLHRDLLREPKSPAALALLSTIGPYSADGATSPRPRGRDR